MPTCLPPGKDREIWLKPHGVLNLSGSPVCWSQKICQGGYGVQSLEFNIVPDFFQAHWIWPDEWNPIFIPAGPAMPDLRMIHPVCERILGVGNYKVWEVTPPSTSYPG